MSIILSNAQIIDPEAGRVFLGGLVIEKGRISEVFEGKDGKRAGSAPHEQQDCKGAYLAPGIVDIGVKIGEPGERHKESFKSASDAALAGGVTTILMRADTSPAIDTPETLAFVRARAAETARINVLHSAALTRAREGSEMNEIGFLRDAGAAAYSDGDAVIADSKIALRAYHYVAMMGGLVIGHVQEPYLSSGTVASAGGFAARLGLSGASPMAEKIGCEREMALAEISGVRYHIDQITAGCALPTLERAKSAGIDVSAGTSIHHLTLNEEQIGDYRTFFKIKPPLRGEADRRAMIGAVKSGLIDIISSMHTPQDEESKRLPFEDAAAGAVGLETLLPASLGLVHSGDLTLPELFAALSTNPAKRLGLECGRMKAGAPADLVLFEDQSEWVLDRWTLHSKAKNTPYDGMNMRGKVLASFVAGERCFDING